MKVFGKFLFSGMDRIFFTGAEKRALTRPEATLSLAISLPFRRVKTAKAACRRTKNEIIARQISSFTFHNSLFMK